ncbi:mediator complex subunit 27-domain-containing protein [Talaromyces proteolyticus]|uniref:Mediator complex subunit 27-domain-containing protein n=1 Tax=Talaromyces proteolyticus TaxID=1131652 RepID=A0AAD4KZF5_9EURO|nr:mediator complex subunit 27-domain-containing protein [Talaromyces proteolyticus]KAH8703448.1 mediator complex subunit 27-domain-containing protein [Talaromyces proteolyticus]
MPKQQPVTQQNTQNGNNMNIKLEDPPTQSVDWDSERQIVSSLAKLQELEAKIHELRSLLPDRLLAPISPIVNPRQRSPSNPIPRNPQELNARLTKSAAEGVAELNNFKGLWQSPDVQEIWARINQKMTENKGSFPQPSGMWDRDYEILLKEIDGREDNSKQSEMNQNGKDDTQHTTLSSKTEEGKEGWKNIIESFQNNQSPGFRITTSKNASMIIVTLGLAGITLDIQEIITNAANTSDSGTPASAYSRSLPEWRVSAAQQSIASRPASRLESAIVQQLNNRPRKWDLRYLLEMMQAYTNIKRTPCKKCNLMTDSQAQLPIVRRPVGQGSNSATGENINASSGSENGENTITWEAYHTSCL